MASSDSWEGRNAVVFAATGEVAGATALELAKRGARLFLSGRDVDRVRDVASRIAEQTGVEADCRCVDAEDEAAVAGYLRSLTDHGVAADWMMNGIGLDPVKANYGQRSQDLPLASFLEPLTRIVGSQFLTATLAAAPMAAVGSGTIVLLTSSLAKSALPFMAGITSASDAVQGLARVLAAEYAPRGVRVHCVRVSGIPESRTIRLTSAANAKTMGITPEAFAARAGSDGSPLTLEAAAAGIVAATSPDRAGTAGQPIDIEATHERR